MPRLANHDLAILMKSLDVRIKIKVEKIEGMLHLLIFCLVVTTICECMSKTLFIFWKACQYRYLLVCSVWFSF